MEENKLPNEKEIKESLNRYLGFLHTKINMLSDMDYAKIIELSEKGWFLDSNEQELEKLINDFVNVYGYIYDQGSARGVNRLIRGTTTKEASRLHRGNEIPNILSTSESEQIAKRFCEYNNAALIRIKVEEGLPHIYAESERDENSANEEEVLILPFAKIKESQFTSNWNGYKYYDITLEKSELPDVSEERLEQLKSSCISGYRNFMEQIRKYKTLTYGREHPDYSRFDEISPILTELSEYKRNMRELLKGLCRKREKAIDLKRDEELLARMEEQKKREEERIVKLNAKIQERKEILETKDAYVKESLKTNLSSFINKIKKYGDRSNVLGVASFNTQNLEKQLQEKMEKILESRYENDKEQSVDEQYNELTKRLEKYEDTNELLEQLQEIEKKYDGNSFFELKKNLNDKVQKMIYQVEIDKLNKQRQINLSQKDNFINKLLGKTALKYAKIENIEAKMQYASKKMQAANPSNSVRQMLVDIYECAYDFNGGVLTPEMMRTEESIRKVFTNLPNQDTLNRMMQSKKELPVQAKKGFFTWMHNRQEVKRLKEETQNINIEEKAMQPRGRANNNLISLYEKYSRTLDKLDEIVSGKKNDTMVRDLWTQDIDEFVQ